jgi:N-methylhydantoinase B
MKTDRAPATDMREPLDAIALEVIRCRLLAIPEQIETNVVRTAYSTLIYEYKDFAVGLLDRDGRLIAQGRGGIPVFVANLLGLAVMDGLAIYGPDGFHPGDVVICNHAAVLGQHLNNVAMYTPVFDPAGDLFGFMAIVVHWADVGGKAIGSFTANDSTDIFQEGTQFRTLKLWSRGRRVEEIYRVVESNTRFPDLVMGDLEAQLAGCMLGRDLFSQTVARHGSATLRAAIERIWAQSEAAARAVVRKIPDGTYEASAFLDDDGVDHGKRIEVPVSVSVSGETLTVDFSRVSAQVRGPFNSGAHGGGITAARMAFNFIIGTDDGSNDGTYRPLEVILPPGKFLSAASTAPMARYNAPLATVIDVILRAMERAMPLRIAAGHHGTIGSHLFTGKHPATGELFKNQETALGGWGALAGEDGTGIFKTYVHGDTQNVPVELQEALYPMRIDSMEIRPDSGGAGEFRGSPGITKAFTMLAAGSVSVNFDRVGCPPWGLAGGAPGEPGRVIHERAGQEQKVVYKASLGLQPGDRVIVETGGGGGFGPASARTSDRLLNDLREGYVSAAGAEKDYGWRSGS